MWKRIRLRQSNLKKRLGDRKGQATTEYILILAVAVLLAVKFKSVITNQMTGIIDKVGGKINTAVDDME